MRGARGPGQVLPRSAANARMVGVMSGREPSAESMYQVHILVQASGGLVLDFWPWPEGALVRADLGPECRGSEVWCWAQGDGVRRIDEEGHRPGSRLRSALDRLPASEARDTVLRELVALGACPGGEPK